MRVSNRKAVMYLLKEGYDNIWLKPHTRRADLVYTIGEWYRALDLWNLFDGIAFNPNGEAVYIQIKTNAWAKEKPIKDFLIDKKNFLVMSINVKYTGKEWKILIREYNSKDYEEKRKRTVHRKRGRGCSRNSKTRIRRRRRV